MSHEKAMVIVGIIAEERQIADMLGYNRGFNNGFKEAESRYKLLS